MIIVSVLVNFERKDQKRKLKIHLGKPSEKNGYFMTSS